MEDSFGATPKSAREMSALSGTHLPEAWLRFLCHNLRATFSQLNLVADFLNVRVLAVEPCISLFSSLIAAARGDYRIEMRVNPAG